MVLPELNPKFQISKPVGAPSQQSRKWNLFYLTVLSIQLLHARKWDVVRKKDVEQLKTQETKNSQPCVYMVWTAQNWVILLPTRRPTDITINIHVLGQFKNKSQGQEVTKSSRGKKSNSYVSIDPQHLPLKPQRIFFKQRETKPFFLKESEQETSPPLLIYQFWFCIASPLA